MNFHAVPTKLLLRVSICRNQVSLIELTKNSSVLGISSIDLTPDDTTATGVRPNSVKSALMSRPAKINRLEKWDRHSLWCSIVYNASYMRMRRCRSTIQDVTSWIVYDLQVDFQRGLKGCFSDTQIIGLLVSKCFIWFKKFTSQNGFYSRRSFLLINLLFACCLFLPFFRLFIYSFIYFGRKPGRSQ